MPLMPATYRKWTMKVKSSIARAKHDLVYWYPKDEQAKKLYELSQRP